jgi:DNA-binding CsgD family transcriptional regulator
MDVINLLRQFCKLTNASSEREGIAAILEVFTAVVGGDHYSAAYQTVGSETVDMKRNDEGWLGIDHEFCRLISTHGPDHPFVQNIKANPRSTTLIRSQLLDDEAWKRTEMYRCVDEPLGIHDMIGIYFPTLSGHLGGVFCGRGHVFTDSEFERAEEFRCVVEPLFHQIPIPEEVFCGVKLSARQEEIMHWVTEGKTNPEIAIILGISQHTVRKHLENIYAILDVENRTSAAVAWNAK